MLWIRRGRGLEYWNLRRWPLATLGPPTPQSAPDVADAADASTETESRALEERGASREHADAVGATSPNTGRGGRRRWLDALAVLALVAAIVYLHTCVVRIAFITQGSMISAISPGDRVLVHLAAYNKEPPQRGDIIALRSGADGGHEVKRVIGVGGDELMVGWGIVFRNGKPLDEPYVHQVMFPEDPVRVTLGEDQLFVMGDNRNGSEDSRDYGPIHESQVLGRVCWRILPLGRAGPVR